tara:strand:+ start:1138 stop:1362 length:225 start_codon:yes stop_codon:yes gene_type:complete
MDKINMMDYQQYVLKKKFKKNQTQEKKSISLKVILVLLAIFFSLGFFLNTESQALIGSDFSILGSLNLGAYFYG